MSRDDKIVFSLLGLMVFFGLIGIAGATWTLLLKLGKLQ